MTTAENLEKIIASLKKQIIETTSNPENKISFEELRVIKKKLKRAQRKSRVLFPSALKEKPDETVQKAKTV